MTFQSERIKAARRLFRVLELALDYCDLTYGTSPCAAVLGTTGTRKCFNTRATCQNPTNYAPSAKTYRFFEAVEGVPRSFDGFPLLLDVEYTPGRIDPGRSLGQRAEVRVTLQDGLHHDRGVDKYVAERETGAASSSGERYVPYQRGTVLGRLKSRNAHYVGRLMRVRSGYLPWNHKLPPEKQPAWTEAEVLAGLQTRLYVIESMNGPDAKGRMEIVGKDILKLTDGRRAVLPVPNSGRLVAAISAVGGTATLTPTGVGNSEYPASGTVVIDSEAMTFTRAGDVLTLTARGTDGTTAAAHAINAAVQLAKRYTSQRVDAILQDLLNVGAGINITYLPVGNWDREADVWLSTHIFSLLITEPTGVDELVSSLMLESSVYCWWNEVDQRVEFKAVRPWYKTTDPAIVALDDSSHVVADSLAVEELPNERITRVFVRFARADPTEPMDQKFNEQQGVLTIDADAESSDEFDDVRMLEINCRWLDSSNRAQAVQLAARMLARYGQTPRRLRFRLDAKDIDLETGEIFTIAHHRLQDETGAALAPQMQVIEMGETAGGLWDYLAVDHRFTNRYGFIGPNTLANYSSSAEADKDRYAWIAQNTGDFADGSTAYRII